MTSLWGRWSAVAVAVAGALLFDVFTPRGVASGTLYIIAVLLVPTVSTWSQLLTVAVTASLLNVTGYFVSTPVDPWWMGPVNRAIATGLLWAVTLLAWRRIVAVRREQHERARWETTVCSMGDAVIVTDAIGTITFLNEAACQLTGWARDDAYGRTFAEVLPLSNAETGAAVVNPIRRVLAEGQVFGLANHTVLRRHDGLSVPIDDSAAPIRSEDGNITGAVMVLRDVSERYVAEAKLAAALAESAQRARDAEEAQHTLRALMTFIPEGITIGDAPDVRIRMISQYGLELLGRDDPALRGTAETHPDTWDILNLDHRRPRPEELPLTRSVVRGEVISNELWILRHASGEERVISCNAGPIRDSGGHITGGVIAWRDVSRQHEMEQEIRRQAEALRAHDRSKDQFLSMISHELRQPLGALRAAAQVLRRHASSGNDRLLRPVEVVERQVNHLARLVDDLLDVARMTQGKFGLVAASIDLVQVVRDAVDAVEAEATAAKVSLRIELPPQVVPVRGDAVRLGQLVLNLLTNALRHTPDGGRITCTVGASGDHNAVIRIVDTGRGIPADLLPHLFEPFVQGTHAAAAGLGLGLAIAKGIVELHHGTITAHSDGVDQGASFEIVLPLITREIPT